MQKINYQTYFENSPVATLVADQAGRLLCFNAAASSLFGVSVLASKQAKLRNLLVPETPPDFWVKLEGLQPGETCSTQVSLAGSGGTVLSLYLEVLKTSDQELLIYCRDNSSAAAAASGYEMLFKNMVNGFARHRIITDEKGRAVDYEFIEANKAFEEMTGLKRAEIINQRVSAVLPDFEKDPVDWISRYGEVALSGKSTRFEEYFAPLNKWFQISAYSPALGFFNVLLEDITARKQLETELRKGQEHYKYLLNSLDELVMIVGQTAQVIYANQKVFDSFGYKQEEFVGQSITKFLTPQSVPQALAALSEEFAGKDYGGIEVAVITKSGQEKILKVAPKSATVREGDQLIGLLISGHDVSQERENEKNLKKLAEEWSTTFDSMIDGVALLDKNHIILNVNKAYCQILGTNREGVLNKEAADILINTNDEKSFCALDTGALVTPTKLERFDERLGKWLSFSSTCVYDRQGGVSRYVQIVRDVTEMKSIEKETEMRSRQLERFNALMVGREEKMIELKKRIKDLEAKSK